MTTEAVDQYLNTKCRYCDAPLTEPFLSLGARHPLANNLIQEEDRGSELFTCPLELSKCPSCHLVQLRHAVPADLMFKHYLYVSSTTQTFRDHFAEYANTVKKKLGQEDVLAVDIGSNDGLLVSCYIKEGLKGVGVDPAENLAKAANEAGIPTINSYFDEQSVSEIVDRYGKAHAISGNNVFAHIDDIQSVVKNVNELLHDEGFFVIEFPYLMTMLDEMLFDMIYHEHVSYIGVTALSNFYQRFGLEIFDIQEVSSHGGSLRVFAQKIGGPYQRELIVDDFLKREADKGYLEVSAYEDFAARVIKFKEDLRVMLSDIKSQGKTVVGYGAPAKATTIVNFCELDTDLIDYVIDDNPLKQGYLIPGGDIPIVSSKVLETDPPDYILIFAWNFAKEIIEKIDYLREKGVKFIVPLPEPKIM